MNGVLFNQDSTQIFIETPRGEIEPETLDRLVDGLADCGVTALLANSQAQRTNYDSKVWEHFWDGYDPAAGDDQPFFRPLPTESAAVMAHWVHNMWLLRQQGCDPIERMLARCRQRGVGAWVSLRMNDLHDVDIPESPMLNSFWRQHPEFRRAPYRFESWPDRALDYGRPEVRDYYFALLRESLERWDMDGLELDFMRFPYHFRVGHEEAGGEALAAWLGEIRRLLREWEQRRGHGLQLGVRVPSRPPTARALGLDAVSWARAGLVDLVVPTPFWATCEFDLPMEYWRDLLSDCPVTLAAGLEVSFQAHPGAPRRQSTPETARGAAISALARGADAIYLFNHFAHLDADWPPGAYRRFLREAGSREKLRGQDRRHVLTYPDVVAPGEPQAAALPAAVASGRTAAFRLHLGPGPGEAATQVILELAEDGAELEIRLNGDLCAPAGAESPRRQVFTAPRGSAHAGYNVIEATGGSAPLTIVGVEIAIVAANRR